MKTPSNAEIEALTRLGMALAGRPQFFTAATAHGVDQIKACAMFLGEVVRLGAPREMVGTLEEAYWQLLDSASAAGSFESVPLFQPEVRTVDREAVSNALQQFTAGLKDAPLWKRDVERIGEEFLALVDRFSDAAFSGDIEKGVRDGLALSVTIGPLLRAAGFLAVATVPPENKDALRSLVLEKVLPGQLKAFSAAMDQVADQVRTRLGISEAAWRGEVDRRAPLASEEDAVRAQLGMTREEWDRPNAGA